MSFYYTSKSKPKPILYHFSKDKRIRGRTEIGLNYIYASIYDNRVENSRPILHEKFSLKEMRKAYVWLYEHLDCPLFTMLQSLPIVSK